MTGVEILSSEAIYNTITSNEDSIKYIQYKVTIDETVSMVEFMDKYEIIDQEGKIYTVRERE